MDTARKTLLPGGQYLVLSRNLKRPYDDVNSKSCGFILSFLVIQEKKTINYFHTFHSIGREESQVPGFQWILVSKVGSSGLGFRLSSQ